MIRNDFHYTSIECLQLKFLDELLLSEMGQPVAGAGTWYRVINAGACQSWANQNQCKCKGILNEEITSLRDDVKTYICN